MAELAVSVIEGRGVSATEGQGAAATEGQCAAAGRHTLEANVTLELAWIEDGRAHVRALEIDRPLRTSYRELLASAPVAKLLERLGWPEFRWSVFGARRDPDEMAVAGDRIELLPPLLVDPKIARQRRVEHRRRQAARTRWLPDRRT